MRSGKFSSGFFISSIICIMIQNCILRLLAIQTISPSKNAKEYFNFKGNLTLSCESSWWFIKLKVLMNFSFSSSGLRTFGLENLENSRFISFKVIRSSIWFARTRLFRCIMGLMFVVIQWHDETYDQTLGDFKMFHMHPLFQLNYLSSTHVSGTQNNIQQRITTSKVHKVPLFASLVLLWCSA